MSKRSPHVLKQAATRAALALAAALSFAPLAVARQKEAPASVSGRVREGERGVANVTVVLMSNDPARRFNQVARAKTDGEGRYQLAGVAPGRYQIMPVTPVLVMQGVGMMESWPPGRPLTLQAGEEVADVDFRVERGGVITGRVTDGEGNPAIAEAVTVEPADDKTPQIPRTPFDGRDRMTDDRGVYRIYGLAAGRYRVSVGTGGAAGAISYGRRKVFERTYYPGVTEQAQARLVEVRAGEEAGDVDIAIGRAIKTYTASGRFVSVETGQPVAGVTFAYGTLDRRGVLSSFGGGMTTNANGEFQTEGLAPGRYSVYAMPTPRDTTDFYSDPVAFEVTNADVTGIVVPLKHGSTLSGVITIEGVADRALTAKLLSQVRVFGWVETENRTAPPSPSRTDALGPDGSFRLAGLRPGKLRLFYNDNDMASKSLSLVRVEVNGAPVGNDGIRVTEGAQITGVRLRLAYGTGVIRGQTVFLNGALPTGMRLVATARALGAGEGGDAPSRWRRVEADVRGFFRLEGLPAGEYEVMVSAFGGGRDLISDRQRVVVTDGAEVSVSPVIDMNRPPPPPRVVPVKP
jgi:hypothetical protein